ncbi:MAG: response regulator [Pseudomonadota bacterium]
MKRLDVSQLLELCKEIGVDEDQLLTDALFTALDQLATAAADKLGVAACGVDNSDLGVLASFAPKADGEPCPDVLASFDDEGEWQAAPRRTLLVCDENHDQTRLASRAVANLGVSVVETHSADEAWQAYQENRVNLVIADTHLPGEDGVDLLNKIVALEGSRGHRRNVPVITISRDAGSETDSQASSPADAAVRPHKPLDWERLGPVISELCQSL